MQRTDQVDFISSSLSYQPQAALLTQQALRWMEHDLPLAVSLLEKAVKPEESAEPLAQAAAWLQLGRCRLWLGQDEQALGCFQQANEVFAAGQSTGELAACTSGAGLTRLRLGFAIEGFACLYQALEQAQACGEKLRLAEVQADMGSAYVFVEQPDQAMPYLLESAETFRKLDHPLQQGAVYDTLCQAYYQRQAYIQALEYGLVSAHLAEEAQAWLRLAESLRSLGKVYQAQGQADSALDCYRRALNLTQKHGLGLLGQAEAGALQAIGEIYREQGRPDLALVSLQDGLTSAEQVGSIALQIECCRGLVETFKQRQDFQSALAYQERLQALKAARLEQDAIRQVRALEVSRQLAEARRQAEVLRQENAALLQQIEERKRSQIRLEHLANTDPLTGIVNRRRFYHLAKAELERARCLHLPLSLIMFDLDHFKVINDTYGHMAGDEVLVEIARRVGEHVRREDILARFGGEEFVVLLPETNRPLAQITAERLRQRIGSSPIQVAVAALSITISLGVAFFPGLEALSLEKMLDYADRALYQAKESGRNRVMCYTGTHESLG